MQAVKLLVFHTHQSKAFPCRKFADAIVFNNIIILLNACKSVCTTGIVYLKSLLGRTSYSSVAWIVWVSSSACRTKRLLYIIICYSRSGLYGYSFSNFLASCGCKYISTFNFSLLFIYCDN